MATNRESSFSWFTNFDVYTPYNDVRKLVTAIKIIIIMIIFIVITVFIASNGPSQLDESFVSVEPNKQGVVRIMQPPASKSLCMKLTGHIDVIATQYPEQSSHYNSLVTVRLENFDKEENVSLWQSDDWSVFVSHRENEIATVKKCYVLDETVVANTRIGESQVNTWDDPNFLFRAILTSNAKESIGFRVIVDSNPLNVTKGVGLSIILLIFLYVLIVFIIVDRTLAALLALTAAVAVLCVMNNAPTITEMASWNDMDTLIFIFCMMIMTSVLAKTGFLDYATMIAYKLSKGHVWRLLFYLYMLTGILSALWTSVATVLLLVPITERLCEVLGLHTPLVLHGVAIFANIGGTLTPLGCQPNFIITNNRYIEDADYGFFSFTFHMLPGVFISMLVSFVLFCYMVRDKLIETTEQKLNRLIEAYERRLSLTSRKNQETAALVKRIAELRDNLNDHKENIFTENPNFEATLKDMEEKHKITDRQQLIKCCIAFGFAFVMLLLNELPWFAINNVCWVTILALLLLLILIDVPEMDKQLEHVEWSVLIFLSSLYVFVHALEILGLIDWLGEQMFQKITSAKSLLIAILALIWVSGVASALVNNIPIATVLSKVAVKLAYNKVLHFPLSPLAWAICYGAGFGANACMLGSSANIVTVGLAYRKGHNIRFQQFLIIGIPIMITTCLIATIYLLFAHGILN